MEAIEYLKRVEALNQIIALDNKELSRLKALKSQIKPKEYIKIEKKTQNDILRMEETRMEIIEKIHELNDGRYICILYEKYMNQKEMSDIADQIGYSVEHTWRLHTLAIKEFQKILEKDNKQEP